MKKNYIVARHAEHDKNYIPAVNGLKGMAALIVVLHHFVYAFFPAAQTAEYEISHIGVVEMIIHRSPLYFFVNGEFMVKVFWCVSGFLLASLWHKEHNIEKLRRRIINKYLKLVMPVLASVYLAYVLMQCGGMQNAVTAQYTWSSWYGNFYLFRPTILSALKEGVLEVFFYGQSFYNPILWTMKGELFGSFFTGAFLLLFSGTRHKVLYYSVFFMISAIVYVPLCCFVLGMVVADCYDRGIELSGKQSVVLLIMVLLLSSFLPIWAFVPQFINVDRMMVIDVGSILYAIAAAMLLLLVCSSKIMKIIFDSKVFQVLGKYSVALFVIHCPLMCSVAAGIFNFLHRTFSFGYLLEGIATLVLYLVILFVVCVFFTKFIIKNWNRLIDNVWKRNK